MMEEPRLRLLYPDSTRASPELQSDYNTPPICSVRVASDLTLANPDLLTPQRLVRHPDTTNVRRLTSTTVFESIDTSVGTARWWETASNRGREVLSFLRQLTGRPDDRSRMRWRKQVLHTFVFSPELAELTLEVHGTSPARAACYAARLTYGPTADTFAVQSADTALGRLNRTARYARVAALLDEWAAEPDDFDARVGPRIEQALEELSPRHRPET